MDCHKSDIVISVSYQETCDVHQLHYCNVTFDHLVKRSLPGFSSIQSELTLEQHVWIVQAYIYVANFPVVNTTALHGPGWLNPRIQRRCRYIGLTVNCTDKPVLLKGQPYKLFPFIITNYLQGKDVQTVFLIPHTFTLVLASMKILIITIIVAKW